MMLEDAINDFINYCSFEKGFTNRSIDSYKNDLKIYTEFLDSKGIRDVKSIDSNIIKEFVKNRTNYNSTTIAHNLTVVKNFHKYLEKSKIVDKDYSQYIDRPKLKKSLPKVMNDGDIDKLLDIEENSPLDIRNKAMLELMYGAGLRISELINLKLNDIDEFNAIIHVYGKGSKERVVPINEYCIDCLNKYLNVRSSIIKNNDCDFLFINNQGRQISRIGFFKVVKKLLKEKGLNTSCSPHTLRHSFATDLVNNGADLRIVQEMLGHSDISTTKIYTEINNQLTSREYDDYHPRSVE